MRLKELNLFINAKNRMQLINSIAYISLLKRRYFITLFLCDFARNQDIIYDSNLDGVIVSSRPLRYFLLSREKKLLISNDLGIVNKIIIILMPCKAIIIDDGTASLYRSSFFYSASGFIMKKIKFYSSYPRIFQSQSGFFNKNFFYNKIAPSLPYRCFVNKLFFISSNSLLDGLLPSCEAEFYRRLKNYAVSLGLELIVIMHPTEGIKSYHSNFLTIYTNPNFECWYSSNIFENCTFATLYSSSIVCVSNAHSRIFITDLFHVKLKKTFLRKILFLQSSRLNNIHHFYKTIGIMQIHYKDIV